MWQNTLNTICSGIQVCISIKHIEEVRLIYVILCKSAIILGNENFLTDSHLGCKIGKQKNETNWLKIQSQDDPNLF
jgi:hypothetical protein